MRTKIGLGLFLIAIALFFVFVPPIPQSQDYLLFADDRTFLGVNNFWNVISNLPFLFVGAWGFLKARQLKSSLPYCLFFVFIFLTGFGSAYFHHTIGLDTLFWDRLPISLAFMSLIAGMVGDRWGTKAEKNTLLPLLALGAWSVLSWYRSEQAGAGDLRLYILVQFGSMLLLPIAILFIPSRYTGEQKLWTALGWYVVAKVVEIYDRGIYGLLGNQMSGHALKHLTAAAGAFYILKMLQERRIRK